jgi:hypothetical protein
MRRLLTYAWPCLEVEAQLITGSGEGVEGPPSGVPRVNYLG